MPIKYIQPGQVGVSNVTPSWIYIETNDTYAQVTASGYLSGAAREYVNTFKNNMMALISTKTTPGIGVAPVLYTLQLQNVNGVWSLIAPAVDVPIPFVVEGNIQAGSSGVAGEFISYPGTAAKGSLIVEATANIGNTTTTVTNDAMGQASVINIPDPVNAIGQFLVGATATPFVSGNLVEASGTSGLMIDSGIPAANYAPLTATVTMTAAQVNAAFVTPFQIIATPGASTAILIISAAIVTEVSTAFTAGGVAQLQYGNTTGAGGNLATSATIATAEITAATSQIFTQTGISAATALATATYKNKGIFFSNATQAFATGTGSTVTCVVQYYLVPAV